MMLDSGSEYVVIREFLRKIKNKRHPRARTGQHIVHDQFDKSMFTMWIRIF
jgi:hypothetical protein